MATRLFTVMILLFMLMIMMTRLRSLSLCPLLSRITIWSCWRFPFPFAQVPTCRV